MSLLDELPDRQVWARAAADGVKIAEIGSFPIPLLTRRDTIATVGTALAAKLVAGLTAHGFSAIRTEDVHPALADIPAETADYETFSAGYGEVHSARELLQLIRRSTRAFAPREDRWHVDGAVVDPYRPGLVYAARSDREFDLLQERHLNSVRSAFRRSTAVIVSLASSEVCESIVDGAVFPAWPGTVSGVLDEERHGFRTLTIEETRRDLEAAVAELRTLNPAARVILMISPEPMAATASESHVAAASLYGKSVLRVAMEHASQLEGVEYFPALEIVTALGAAAFEADGATLSERTVHSVTEALVEVSEGGSVAPAEAATVSLPPAPPRPLTEAMHVAPPAPASEERQAVAADDKDERTTRRTTRVAKRPGKADPKPTTGSPEDASAKRADPDAAREERRLARKAVRAAAKPATRKRAKNAPVEDDHATRGMKIGKAAVEPVPDAAPRKARRVKRTAAPVAPPPVKVAPKREAKRTPTPEQEARRAERKRKRGTDQT